MVQPAHQSLIYGIELHTEWKWFKNQIFFLVRRSIWVVSDVLLEEDSAAEFKQLTLAQFFEKEHQITQKGNFNLILVLFLLNVTTTAEFGLMR